MKRKRMLILLVFTLIISNQVTAQLKVLSNGNVGIRNSNPTFDIDANISTLRLQNWTNIMLEWNGLCGSPVLYPTTDWYLQLGKNKQRVGTFYAYTIHSTQDWKDSDDSIKTNVNSISNALSIIQNLQGKEYYFTESFIENIPSCEIDIRDEFTRKHFGFMAREVITVLPEIVKHDTATDRYFVNYMEVIPILTAGINEQQLIISNLNGLVLTQQNTITQLQNQITYLTTQINELQTSISNINVQLSICCSNDSSFKSSINNNDNNNSLSWKYKQDNTETTTSIFLYQNNPNPFDSKTEIRYYLPETVSAVTIIISNLNGEQIRAFKNLEYSNGNHSVIVEGSSLSAGSYYYTLLVNGKEISTKKMILVK